MKQIRKALLIGVLLAQGVLQAAASSSGAGPAPAFNRYKGEEITPRTLYDMAPYAMAPEAVRGALDAWKKTPEAGMLLSGLLAFDQFPNWRAQMAQNKQLMQALQIANESVWNYVFKVPRSDYYIKISGPLSRLQSMLVSKGVWPGMQPSPETMRQLIAGHRDGTLDTFQTASRVAHYLILKELIEKRNLRYLAVPETHLVYSPGSPESITDKHVFVLQKALPAGAKKLDASSVSRVPNEAISQLIQAIVGTGLWNMQNNIFVDEAGKMHLVLHVADLEQPNNSAPQDFFHKNVNKFHGDIRAGLEELMKLFVNDKEKLNFIKSEIVANPVIQSASFSKRYKREIDGLVNTFGGAYTPAAPAAEPAVVQEEAKEEIPMVEE